MKKELLHLIPRVWDGSLCSFEWKRLNTEDKQKQGLIKAILILFMINLLLSCHTLSDTRPAHESHPLHLHTFHFDKKKLKHLLVVFLTNCLVWNWGKMKSPSFTEHRWHPEITCLLKPTVQNTKIFSLPSQSKRKKFLLWRSERLNFGVWHR